MARAVWLLSREHGAWVQLLLPLGTALALAPSQHLAPWLLASAALAGFCAGEPLLVAAGVRGKRLQHQHLRQARWQAGGLGGVAVTLGLSGLALAPRLAIQGALAAALLALALLVVALARRGHTPSGEVLAAATLASAGLPVALAGGVEPALALACLGVWATGFALATLAVHAAKARAIAHEGKGRGYVVALAAGLLQAGLGAIDAPGHVQVAMAALLVAAALIAVLPVPLKRMKRVGMGLAIAGTASMAALLLG